MAAISTVAGIVAVSGGGISSTSKYKALLIETHDMDGLLAFSPYLHDSRLRRFLKHNTAIFEHIKRERNGLVDSILCDDRNDDLLADEREVPLRNTKGRREDILSGLENRWLTLARASHTRSSFGSGDTKKDFVGFQPKV